MSYRDREPRDAVHFVGHDLTCARCGVELRGYPPGTFVTGDPPVGIWRTHRRGPRCGSRLSRAAPATPPSLAPSREELQGQDE